MNFSIIVTTNRNIEALDCLFITAHKNSELIIVDSNYNTNTKKALEQYKNRFKQIIYAPVHEVLDSGRDFSQGLNTGLALAENHWIIRADDSLEFKPDFFEVAEQSVLKFRNETNSDKFVICGQKLWESQSQEKWNDYFAYPNIEDRYIKIPNPTWSFSFGLVPLEAYYILNGYDVKYDLGGWGYDDHNFLHRLMAAGYAPIMDRKLMAYSYDHPSGRNTIEWNKFVYDIDRFEIQFGKIKAFNPYSFAQLRENYLKEKNKFII